MEYDKNNTRKSKSVKIYTTEVDMVISQSQITHNYIHVPLVKIDTTRKLV